MPTRSASRSFARLLGQRIYALRLEAGITQERLAWDVGLSKAFLSQIEHGKRVPSLQALALIAKRLGVELCDVVAFRMTEPRVRLLDAARRGDRAAVAAALKRLGLP